MKLQAKIWFTTEDKLLVSESMRELVSVQSLHCLLSTRHLGCMNVLA